MPHQTNTNYAYSNPYSPWQAIAPQNRGYATEKPNAQEIEDIEHPVESPLRQRDHIAGYSTNQDIRQHLFNPR